MSGRRRGKGRADRQAAAQQRDLEKEINLRLASAGPTDDRKGFQMEFRAAEKLVQLIAASMVTWFDGEGATNYVEFQVAHKKRGPFVFCLQRKFGKTPHQLREKAEKERDAALARVAELEAAR